MGLLPRIFEIATGYWASQAVYVAARLGIAGLLADGPKSGEEIACATGANTDAVCRLMRALAALGVFATGDRQRFHLTDIGAPLRSGTPGSLRSMLLTMGEEHFHAWGKLLHSVQTGVSAFDRVYDQPLFEYLRSNTAAGETFHDAMTEFTRQAALACVFAYDFSGIRSLVDVGGGRGAFIDAILRSYPLMTGTLFDSPDVIENARQNFKAAGIADRCQSVAGNFFESIPFGADAYLLKNVLHDWGDHSAIAILQNCRRAMDEHARLLVIEAVLPEDKGSPFENLLDLNMLVMSSGRERTERQYRALLEQTGFRLTKVTPTMAPVNIIEAVPVGSKNQAARE